MPDIVTAHSTLNSSSGKSSDSLSLSVLMCPRCGYDLRTQFETRDCSDESGNGVCSECGLDFKWARILQIHQHPWLFERHARSRPVYSYVQTTLMLLRPWKFWREVEMGEAVHAGRIALLALVHLTIAAVLAVISMIGLHLIENLMYGWRYRWSSPLQEIKSVVGEAAEFGSSAVAVLVLPVSFAVMVPLLLLTLRVSMRRARVLPGHLVRISLYHVAFLMTWPAIAVCVAAIFIAWYYPEAIDSDYYTSICWPRVLVYPIASVVFNALLTACWWGFALSRYLRFPHAWSVSILFSLVCVLAIAAFFASASETQLDQVIIKPWLEFLTEIGSF